MTLKRQMIELMKGMEQIVEESKHTDHDVELEFAYYESITAMSKFLDAADNVCWLEGSEEREDEKFELCIR